MKVEIWYIDQTRYAEVDSDFHFFFLRLETFCYLINLMTVWLQRIKASGFSC